MSTTTPTERQKEVLRYLAAHIQEHGYPPTFRELSAHFGWASVHSAAIHVGELRRMGLVHHHQRRSRTLTITPHGRAFLRWESGRRLSA